MTDPIPAIADILRPHLTAGFERASIAEVLAERILALLAGQTIVAVQTTNQETGK